MHFSTTFDPFPEYIYLGDDVSDGLFAWIQIGIDTTANYIDDEYYSVAAYLDESGGHESTSNAFSAGGDMGNGTAPGNGTTSSNSTSA